MQNITRWMPKDCANRPQISCKLGLVKEDYPVLTNLIKAIVWMNFSLQEKQLSIQRLRSIFGIKTESAKSLAKLMAQAQAAEEEAAAAASNQTDEQFAAPDQNGEPEEDAPTKKDPPEKKGKHGHRPASDYTQAKILDVAHEFLKRGSSCPSCDKGKLFNLSPGSVLRIVGQPWLQVEIYPAIESAYEAGFSGFHLHRVLEKSGIKNLVVHAAGIEVATGDRVKTDKRDSLKIATQLEANRLKGIHVPSEEREEKRALTRLRDTIVEHRTTTANQIKALLHQHGLISPTAKKKICPKWIESLKKLPMRDGIRFALNHLVDMWQQLTVRIKEINAEMAKQAAEDHALEMVYRSTPGIGPVGARILANEVEDMSCFDNERQLFSYTGLTPSEHSSGGHIRKGHISRQGKTVIRRVLVLASWKAIQQDAQLRMWKKVIFNWTLAIRKIS